MPKIIAQIYEVQTPSEAEKLLPLGVDHIGSVIISKESWKVPSILETIRLIQGENAKSSLIPLFDDFETISFMIDYYQPDIIHFCDMITPESGFGKRGQKLVSLQESVRKKFPDIEIMRSIPIAQSGIQDQGDVLELARMFEPLSDYFLTDTLIVKSSGFISDLQPVKGFVGITGKTCSWDMAAQLVCSSRIPVILAGGITPDNVFDAIMQVKPAGIDSCTGTNALDDSGCSIRFKKDPNKVKHLVDETRRAERILETDKYK